MALTAAERAKRYRDGKSVTEQRHVTETVTEAIPGVTLENCRTCGVLLPPLGTPRQSPGMCINCVTDKYHLKQPHVSQTVNRTEDASQEQTALEAELAGLHNDLDMIVGYEPPAKQEQTHRPLLVGNMLYLGQR